MTSLTHAAQKKSRLFQYSFFIVAIVLTVIETMVIARGNWFGDFWEHAAVVKALSENLWHPSNPIIKSDAPHAFFSPYAVIVAAFASIMHLNSYQALGYAAFFNLIIFLICFYKFCTSIFGEKANAIAAISLLFILFFWGKNPFNWSGFYHFHVLAYVLPYPSTFAMGLTFLILSIVAKDQNQQYYTRRLPLVIFLSAIVVLTHPNTAILLFLVTIALNYSFNNNSVRHGILKSALHILPALALASLWPYFSFASFILGNNHDFQQLSRGLYTGRLRINWPVLMIFPGVLIVKKDKIVYFFLTAIALMTAVFVMGFFTGQYMAGRLSSGIMMFSHLLMAYIVISCLSGKPSRGGIIYLALLGISVTACIFINGKSFSKNFKAMPPVINNKYNFLRHSLSPGDVVLSDNTSNEFIAAFNGKVIAAPKPISWIPDIEERRNDIASFYNSERTDSARKSIIDKYHADYILLDYSATRLNASSIQFLQSLGKTVFKQDSMELIMIKK